ncbi:HPr-like protein Crh [Oceanobacillus oncorhynchi subsp. incaldanensis]|uniref:HPr-like protein Crh n=1 Tax=Oceanobacillus oncorhynchi TaxID=545501 RepID=A0A0A1MQB5_9BACI|nr:HPr family phosphocarrier protein [Oceanobacillus oncorhynchi]UUI39121.1 HPr family phosphocarrier protein [Oceanobacillus oncorhynchi]GIO17846.1 HPr-like protein Crh [Oceanobacillus oncorhynchi subsp. incaldanensis]CEI81246.1 HPr-like protein Crh [Oceanobacillus oncorhynchi]
MVEKTVKIELDSGLQARPAAYFVQEANRFDSHIFLENDHKKVNAKSIMGLMSLALTKGEEIKLIIEGEDEEEALEYLTSLVREKV